MGFSQHILQSVIAYSWQIDPKVLKSTWHKFLWRGNAHFVLEVIIIPDNNSWSGCWIEPAFLCFQLIFAFVPPVSIWGGWLAFFVALAMIGGLTLIVGDLAGIFGCLVGLKDSVTAITFVALGTSLPDLFASKQAATMEKTADNSIGNVTGSNSVNVFLGLGLPWLIASIYWTAKVGIIICNNNNADLTCIYLCFRPLKRPEALCFQVVCLSKSRCDYSEMHWVNLFKLNGTMIWQGTD